MSNRFDDEPHIFKVGDLTYVVDHDHNDALKVYARVVTRVSAKQIVVEGARRGRVIHRAVATQSKYAGSWTPILFATIEAALLSYIGQCETERERAIRRQERSNKLIQEARALLVQECDK